MLDLMMQRGRASFILGGQWGSEGKGAAAAYVARHFGEKGRTWDIITTNAGAQAGHTSVHNGKKRVVYHLPTAALISHDYGLDPIIYLNAGSIINPRTLLQELEDNNIRPTSLYIHPNAAIITDECIAAEGNNNSAQTKIASTRKGVGEALARKVLRYGRVARDEKSLERYVYPLDFIDQLRLGASVLVEVPQGIGLSVDEQFYPFCTSRNCTVMSAASDAQIHPHFHGQSMLVLRTYPIRVGNIIENTGVHEDGSPLLKELGNSGGHWDDQDEISWNQLKVPPEITTVTKRVRRVFTFSIKQMYRAMLLTRPAIVQLTFCDYPEIGSRTVDWITEAIIFAAGNIGITPPTILRQYGPTTDDVTVYRP